jgi:hypothetical protein
VVSHFPDIPWLTVPVAAGLAAYGLWTAVAPMRQWDRTSHRLPAWMFRDNDPDTAEPSAAGLSAVRLGGVLSLTVAAAVLWLELG